MKQILLATALIATPVAVFYGIEHFVIGPAPIDMSVQTSTLAPVASLGDLSAFASIVTDAQTIAESGDFKAAEKRITDLETAWDEAEASLRAQAPLLWGNVDESADAAFSALRAKVPDAGKIETALNDLHAALADPSLGGTESGPVETQNGVAVTDAAGHPLPCEVMLSDLRDGVAAGRVPAEAQQQISDLQAKATERCNADDDRRSDGFSAQAIALLSARKVTK